MEHPTHLKSSRPEMICRRVDKLATRLNQKRYSNPRQDEDSEDDVGFVNRSRENIRKHMELDKNDRSHVDDSSLQEEDPVNKRVGAIGGKKTNPAAPKDKGKQAIGSGGRKNASLAGFRQAENNYQPFGGMGSVFNGPRVMGANNYGFGRYDAGYGQPMYDPYGGPPGYGQPGFRGGFAPPYYPQEPQKLLPTSACYGPCLPEAYRPARCEVLQSWVWWGLDERSQPPRSSTPSSRLPLGAATGTTKPRSHHQVTVFLTIQRTKTTSSQERQATPTSQKMTSSMNNTPDTLPVWASTIASQARSSSNLP